MKKMMIMITAVVKVAVLVTTVVPAIVAIQVDQQ